MSEERQDPETLAYQLSEAFADQKGDAAQEYLVRFVDELLVLDPGVKEHFVDTLLGELKEEVARRENPKYVHATIELIKAIEQDWRNDS